MTVANGMYLVNKYNMGIPFLGYDNIYILNTIYLYFDF